MSHTRSSAIAALATFGLLLAACGAATPTAVPPKPTEAPKPTVAAPTAVPPTAAPKPTEAPKPTDVPKPTEPPKPAAYKIGMILVGPPNDGGWNQAHVDAATYVSAKIPGVTFDFVDKVNPADRPNVKGTQVADDLIAKGAKMIIFNSDDFKDDALETAKKYPNIPVIHASGDYSWKDGAAFKNQPNLANIMGQMEYGKMIGGCAAALGTETGKVAYIGPLINEETRRLVSSAYLGARYCYEKYRGKKASDLSFKVTWIGFWFNIPGVTLDPTKVMNEFINGGYDVTISGLDTPEAAQETKKAAAAGKKVKFVHYDLKTGCDLAPDQCLGSPFFNWGPEYVKAIKAAQDGKFNNYPFVWVGPDWKDINNVDTSMVGFTKGKGLGDNAAKLDEFIKGLADGSVNLWKGPLKYQDGTEFVKDGATATPKQIWYLEQLLQGIDGKSK